MKKKDKQIIIEAWRTIYNKLKQTGYDFIYQDEINTISTYLREIK